MLQYKNKIYRGHKEKHIVVEKCGIEKNENVRTRIYNKKYSQCLQKFITKSKLVVEIITFY